MDAPKSIEEIYQRKERARQRFDRVTLIEKIEIMAEHRRELNKVFGQKRRAVAASKQQP